MIQIVCVKQVADTETRVKVGADGKHLDPAGVTWVMNPYDEYAVEQALRIKEASGGEVVAISLGGSGVPTVLRNALAMGADRGVHLKSDITGPDALSVARTLAAAIKPLSPDIVWCGRQAVDDDAAQVGPMLAELLSLPGVTFIGGFELENGKARVHRDIEGGREVVEVDLPAVFTSDKGLNEPRYASLKGIMAAKKKPIEEQVVDLAAPALEVVALEMPQARAAGRIVGQGADAVPELIKVLHEEAKLI